MQSSQLSKLKRYFIKDRLPAPRLTTRIRLQNDLVVVHPRSVLPASSLDPIEEASVAGANGIPDDTLLFGHASIAADPCVQIVNVRVGLVVVYRYKLAPTDEKPREYIIFEQYKAFSQDEIVLVAPSTAVATSTAATTSDAAAPQPQLVHRRVNFDILVPSSLPTYEHSSHGIILPQVRVTVEYGYRAQGRDTVEAMMAPTTTAAAAAAAVGPGGVEEQTEEGSLILGRRMITDRWQGGGTVYVPRKSYAMTASHNSSDSSLETQTGLERRRQTWCKNMAVIANPNPTTGTHALRAHKSGVAPGIGAWQVYLLSDSFSVGGYVIPRLELTSLVPGCTIFAIHLHLHQTFHITPPEEYRFNPNGQEQYNPVEVTCPVEKIPLCTDGSVPVDRRPRRGTTPVLWEGPPRGRGRDVAPGIYVWQQDKVRISDESKARPTTVAGTSTLMRVQHEIAFRIFFSIEGETIGGEPIPGGNQTGEMRMLVLTVPCFLASCCCIAERVKLPEYTEKKTDGTTELPTVPMCACCYQTTDFPTPGFPPEFLQTPRDALPIGSATPDGPEGNAAAPRPRQKSQAATTSRRDLSGSAARVGLGRW